MSRAGAGEGGEGRHLVVLVHGLLGGENDFDNLARLLREGEAAERLEVLAIKSNNSLLRTLDGVKSGAERAHREVRAAIDRLGDALTHLSIVGHSLGGIYARYVLFLLDRDGLLDKVQPCVFATLATPHLGVRRPQNNPFNFIWQRLLLPIIPTTRELGLLDSGGVDGEPLLYTMGTSEAFLAPLGRFRRRVLYSNVINDFQVPYHTASIRHKNPYARASCVPRLAENSNSDSPIKLGASRSLSREHPNFMSWSLDNVHKRRHWSTAQEIEFGIIRALEHDDQLGESSDRKTSADSGSAKSVGRPELVSEAMSDDRPASLEETGKRLPSTPVNLSPEAKFELRKPAKEALKGLFPSEALENKLAEMLFHLDVSVGGWERYDISFRSPFAHEQIINKRACFAGRSVINHFVNHVLHPAHDDHTFSSSMDDELEPVARDLVAKI